MNPYPPIKRKEGRKRGEYVKMSKGNIEKEIYRFLRHDKTALKAVRASDDIPLLSSFASEAGEELGANRGEEMTLISLAYEGLRCRGEIGTKPRDSRRRRRRREKDVFRLLFIWLCVPLVSLWFPLSPTPHSS